MLGRFPVDPPVVLAPMAGITNRAFRQLCREQGAGVYMCEMITTVSLVYGWRRVEVPRENSGLSCTATTIRDKK